MSKITKVIIPVAGFGTRMLPATKSVPKELLPIVDKPLLQYIVDEGRAAGIEQFIFITARNKNAIEDYFDVHYELNHSMAERGKKTLVSMMEAQTPPPGDMIFIRQQEAKGVGHALWCARHLIGDEPFAVMFPDDLILHSTPCLKQMIDAYLPHQMMVAVEEVPLEDTQKYGILDVTHQEGPLVHAKGIVEKPPVDQAPSRMAVVGRYLFPGKIMPFLMMQKPSVGGEIHVADAMMDLMGSHQLVGYRFQGDRFDCGAPQGFLAANVAAALRRPELASDMRQIWARYGS